MAILDIITKEDLQQFKKELVEELKLFKANNSDEKSFLRSSDVRKLLKISPGTLQNYVLMAYCPTRKSGV